MPTEDLEARETETEAYVLPWYLRYARTLALLSGATIGIAAGAAVISSNGCSSCNGICGDVMGTRTNPDAHGFGGAGGSMGVVPNPDAHGFGGAGGFMGVVVAPSDAAADGNDAARPDAIVDGGGDDTGGGPRPAPLLPSAWIG